VYTIDEAMAQLGPIPAAFRFATDVSYGHLRELRSSREGFAHYSLRTQRSLVHDHIWVVARQLLTELPECEIIEEAGTEILTYRDRFKLQVHKIDENGRMNVNGTLRPLDIQGQGHLWVGGDDDSDGVRWVTIGHDPDPILLAPRRVVLGIAVDGGLVEEMWIEPAPDVIAKIGPQAKATVLRLGGFSA
jgi:hypothetical protein